MIEAIRKRIPHEEFDYQTLMDALREYARPRYKVSALLRQKRIIRVKKGLYVFAEDYRKGPFSRQILANLIYGPSYISLDYALAHHGMIPERVDTITSVTVGRSRRFPTPVGLFTYRAIPAKAFRTGMDRVELEKGRDWYELVWYVSHHPELHLRHLEQRMRQSGHWRGGKPLSRRSFTELLASRIESLNVEQARREAESFVDEPESLAVWSREFFRDIASRIRFV